MTPDDIAAARALLAARQLPRTWVAYLLWLPPLGLAGAHWLYLHHGWRAVLYVLTGGLLGLGWLYDGLTLWRQVPRCRAEQLLELADAWDATPEPPQALYIHLTHE